MGKVEVYSMVYYLFYDTVESKFPPRLKVSYNSNLESPKAGTLNAHSYILLDH